MLNKYNEKEKRDYKFCVYGEGRYDLEDFCEVYYYTDDFEDALRRWDAELEKIRNSDDFFLSRVIDDYDYYCLEDFRPTISWHDECDNDNWFELGIEYANLSPEEKENCAKMMTKLHRLTGVYK